MTAFMPGDRLPERLFVNVRYELICHGQVPKIRHKAGLRRAANTTVRKNLDGIFLEHHRHNLLKCNIAVIAGVPGLFIQPFPFSWGMERPACQLPVKQVHLFSLVAVRLDNDIFATASDSLDPLDC